LLVTFQIDTTRAAQSPLVVSILSRRCGVGPRKDATHCRIALNQ
jgi:hypothetical protein